MDIKKVIQKTALHQRLTQKPQRWTKLAVECYKRQNCDGCFYKEFFEKQGQKCNMRLAVIESVKVFGKPTEIQLNEDK